MKLAAENNCQEIVKFLLAHKGTKIDDYCFCNCASLKAVIIPSSVTTIGKCAFKNCTCLEEITFEEPSSLTTIEEESFEGCRYLTEVSIPPSVTSIKKDAFKGCSFWLPC